MPGREISPSSQLTSGRMANGDQISRRHKKHKTVKERFDVPTDSNSTANRPRPVTAADYKISASQRPSYTSPIVAQTASLYLPLSPICQQFPLRGLCAEHLSPLLLTYYAPLDGIVLTYQDVRVSEEPPKASIIHETPRSSLSKVVDEYAGSYVWVTADFLLFRLRRDMLLDGVVNLQNESHIGLVVWNLFNASIDRTCLPSDWTWEDDIRPVEASDAADEAASGCFRDSSGRKLTGAVSFRLRDWRLANTSEAESGHIVLYGTLLESEDDHTAPR